MDQRKLKTFNSTIHHFYHLTIYVICNGFKIFLLTMHQLIENGIKYYDTELIQIYMNQIIEQLLFAISNQQISHFPYIFKHGPCYVEMVLIFYRNKLHYKKLNLLAQHLFLVNFNLEVNQIDKLDSIQPRYIQIIDVNQIRLV